MSAGPLYNLQFANITKKNGRVLARVAVSLKNTTGTPSWNNSVIVSFPNGYVGNTSERYVAIVATPQNQGLIGFNTNGDLVFKSNSINLADGSVSGATTGWVYIDIEYDV